jgi:acyl-coenzyme A synthetase/AMP-(fatty) acid ligase
VSPLEIEQVLETHPDVDQAAVVGVADPALDQAAAAFVVLRAGAAVSDADLKKYCRDRLPAFKVPKVVRMMEALPRSGAGKVLKTELQAQLTREEDT